MRRDLATPSTLRSLRLARGSLARLLRARRGTYVNTERLFDTMSVSPGNRIEESRHA